MGKTKTAFVSGITEKTLSGAEKYKLKQQRKATEEAKKSKTLKGIGLKGGQRIKEVVGKPVEKASTSADKIKAQKGTQRKQGRKHKHFSSKVDKNKVYSLKEAVSLVKKTSYSKFDGTVELHATLKKEGLSIQVSLPYSAGKTKKIEVANEKTLAKLKMGKIDFDVLLATPEMMGKLVPFAKTLGPKGLMPNPKNGTIIKNLSDAKKYSSNQMIIKTERKAPLIHLSIGKVSQKDTEIIDNIKTVIEAIGKRQFLKATLTSTMGPGVKVKIN